ncbi:MAG TPA: sigma-70 family RNA polymerase sigma factor [Chryseosolibacter sp.]
MKQSGSHSLVSSMRRYKKRLFDFIRRRVPSDEDAEDILQDVWYQLYVTTRMIDDVGAWLYRVARNKIIDRYRRKKVDSVEDHFFENEEGEMVFEFILFSETGNPEAEYFRNLFWEQLDLALAELPEEQKDVFVWNELEGRSFAEIAARTGANVKTLISRKGYAVRHLRMRLHQFHAG